MAYSSMDFKNKIIDCSPWKTEVAVLAANGNVYIIDPVLPALREIPTPTPAARLGVDRQQKIWIADTRNSIYVLNDTGWAYKRTVAADIYDIAFDKKNELILITSMGIYIESENMFYATNNYSIPTPTRTTASRPTHTYIDDKGNIWTSSRSRMGVEILRFDRKNKTFQNTRELRLNSLPKNQGIFGCGERLFFLNTFIGVSEILEYISDSAHTIFENRFDPYKGPAKDEELYFGAGFCDDTVNKIYYYSSKGIFSLPVDVPLNSKVNPTRISLPQNAWWNRIPEKDQFAYGVRKMFRSGDHIVFWNTYYGIYLLKDNILVNWRPPL